MATAKPYFKMNGRGSFSVDSSRIDGGVNIFFSTAVRLCDIICDGFPIGPTIRSLEQYSGIEIGCQKNAKNLQASDSSKSEGYRDLVYNFEFSVKFGRRDQCKFRVVKIH